MEKHNNGEKVLDSKRAVTASAEASGTQALVRVGKFKSK
jgi:hypothetical protein